MKYSIAVFLFAAAITMAFAGGRENRGGWKKMAEECASETNTTLPEMKKPNEEETSTQKDNSERGKGHHGPRGGPKAMFKDDKYACLNRCMLIKKGKINEENEIIATDKFVKKMSKKDVNVEDVVQKCMDENVQDDICIQAVRRTDCFHDAFKNGRSHKNKKDGSGEGDDGDNNDEEQI